MNAYLEAADRAARYGVQETNNIGEFTDNWPEWLRGVQGSCDLGYPELVKITRLRLIGACREYPYWDVSYCYGELRDGTRVRVNVGERRLSRYGYKRELVELAKGVGKFGKGMGLLDNISTLAG